MSAGRLIRQIERLPATIAPIRSVAASLNETITPS
jgi:hypothetical protein